MVNFTKSGEVCKQSSREFHRVMKFANSREFHISRAEIPLRHIGVKIEERGT